MEFTRDVDEPLTPGGRLFLQPEFNNVINCAIGFKNPINIEAMKSGFLNSYLMKHPRFSSLLVVDEKGREFWRKTQVNIDDHIIIHHKKNPNLESNTLSEEEEEVEIINAMLADFAVSSPLSMKKPLWEIHLISDFKFLIFRFHHALGDGITVVSLFLASFKRCDGKDNDDDNNNSNVSEMKKQSKGEKKRREMGLTGLLKIIWWTTVYVMAFIGRSLWVRDKKTAISGGDGVELWPKMVATAKFSLQDMKTVKLAIHGATINDVLIGVISSGFSRYLNIRSSHGLQKGLQITGLSMVNIRRQPGLQEISTLMENDSERSKWGNKFGFIILPLYCHTKNEDPLNFVKKAKVMIDGKKHSLEAHFSHNMMLLVTYLFGPKVASMLNHKILCNTTFVISNVVGPRVESTFFDNPITHVRYTSTSFPNAITMYLISYAGVANLQILVAKDIIPDPRFLAKCFEDALLEMKNAAMFSYNSSN